MKKYSFGWVLTLFVLTGLCLVGIAVSTPDGADAQTTIPTCPTGLTINITAGSTLTGMTPLNLGVPTTANTINIDRVVFKVDGKPIGQARRNTTNTASWFMPWATQLMPPGGHQIQAHVFYNQSAQCVTQLMPINVAPISGEAIFALDMMPQTWSGLTNSVIDISTVANTNIGLVGADLAQYIVYQWETNIGTLTPATGGIARFNSGANAGSGRVKVTAYYGGRDVAKELVVNVQSQVTPVTTTETQSSGGVVSSATNAPVPDPAPTTSPSGVSVPLTQEQKVQLIARQIESQPAILSCANQTLTQARIDELRSSGRRLTAQEFQLMRSCFSQTSYVVPSSYAPTEPETVKESLQQTVAARIKDMRTEKAANTEGTERSVLRLEGQAKPGGDVLVYVFSEPLVLYAKADDEGNWVYDLVDPMAPGEHEAYAVVEEADGTYKRSSAFSFLIETAEASSENPNGYSLAVQSVGTLSPPASKRRLNSYMVGSAIVVLAVLVVGGVIVTRTLRHIPDDDVQDGGHGYGAQ